MNWIFHNRHFAQAFTSFVQISISKKYLSPNKSILVLYSLWDLSKSSHRFWLCFIFVHHYVTYKMCFFDMCHCCLTMMSFLHRLQNWYRYCTWHHLVHTSPLWQTCLHGDEVIRSEWFQTIWIRLSVVRGQLFTIAVALYNKVLSSVW